MRHVGDVVGERRDLRFRRRPRARDLQAPPALRCGGTTLRDAPPAVAPVTGPLCLASPSSVSQVRLRPSNCGVLALQRGDDAQALRVVVEAAEGRACASSSARSPAWPNGGWPRSWASASASARSSSRRSARASGARDLRHLERSASAACGSGRPRGRRRPASCGSAGGRRSNG